MIGAATLTRTPPSELAALASAAADWPNAILLPEVVKSEAKPFPFDGLGPVLGAAAKSIAENVQAPDALAGGSVLTTASLAAQVHADVVLPHGQRSPLSIFALTSAESGDRKSATDGIAGLPVDEVRKEQARRYSAELEAYNADKAAKAQRDQEPARPVARSLSVGKATVEGLHMILRSQSSVGLFTAEGGELLGGHSMREDRRSAGLAWFLKAWGGETLDTLTRGDGLSILLGRRVALHAMVQPVLLRQLLSDPLAHGQGFLARCLIAEPRTLAGTRLFRRCRPNDAPEVRAYHQALRRLLERQAPIHVGGDGYELAPRELPLSPMAEAVWIEFYDHVERSQGPGLELSAARAFASKAAEHAARIAAVVEITGDPAATSVGEAAMLGGIEVAAYYMDEHLRLTGASVDDRYVLHLHTLLDWLRTFHAPVSWETVLQKSPNQIRQLKAAGLRPLMDDLQERNYVRLLGPGLYAIRPANDGGWQ